MSIFDYIVLILSIILFMFFYWKNIKEDYVESLIFSSFFYILGMIIMGVVLGNFILKVPWIWGIFLGMFLGLVIVFFRFRMQFFQLLEASAVGILIGLIFLNLMLLLDKHNFVSPLSLANISFAMIIYVIIKNKYKNISWYKSGKPGFSGLIALIVFFLTRIIIDITRIDILSHDLKYNPAEIILFSIIVVTLFLSVYKLAKEGVR